jgi:undecaprenyl phosphate N,N'-diacetylbacillosamine 1-phosphate transferase
MNYYFQCVKRPVDLIGSLILIFVLSPVFLLIIIVYGMSFTFPVFYRQQRIGKNERLFWLTKFRSLKKGEGRLQERRFMLGDFMRATSLDELPQLVHVVTGTMSLVGPRPLPVEYLPFFSDRQRERHAVRPGITGLAQVNGRNSLSWEKKLDYDIQYVESISAFGDLKILLKTVIILLSFKKDVSLDEPKFNGH